LSVKLPPEREQYTGTERIPSYHPSPRGYDTITKKALTDLQQRNKDLLQKVKQQEEAPLLMKNMVDAIKQADNRVKELEQMLKIHSANDQKEARVEELKKSAKRVRLLQERINAANNKKRQMENKLKTKKKLEKKFNKAVADVDELLEKLAYSKYRSKVLEEDLVRVREKERELRLTEAKVRTMQNDLDAANRQLQKLGKALVHEHDRWENRPRRATSVHVDGSAVGHLNAQNYDVHGRKIRDPVKVVELKDQGRRNTYAKNDSYVLRNNKEVDLIRKVNELELSNQSVDRLSDSIKVENDKLAKEVQALMIIMQKKGITLTHEQPRVQQTVVRPQAARTQVVRNVQPTARYSQTRGLPTGVSALRNVQPTAGYSQTRGLPAGVSPYKVLGQRPMATARV